MTLLEDRIRSGLRETAERIPDTAPTRTAGPVRINRPGGVWVAIAAGVAVLVLFTPILFLGRTDPDNAPSSPSTVPTPLPQGDVRPFLDTWVTSDNRATMVIVASEVGGVEMRVADFYSLCAGAPTTMIGAGNVQGVTELVFPSPVLTCDDGSVPESLTGAALEDELRNLTFTHDPGSDVLVDNFGSVWTRQGADPSTERTTPPSEAEVAELLGGFVEARIAGEGAQFYLNEPERVIPLLYTPTSGAPYDRAEFEPVAGVEWPYGLSAFKVRMFAGDTVVEQLFFLPPEGRLGLEYMGDGYGTEIASTTENGRPVPYLTYSFFDGEVIMHFAHPWVSTGGDFLRLIPEGVGPTTDGGERNDWDQLNMVAVERSCQIGPAPLDAEELARSIRSDPELGTTAPVAVSSGGAEGLRMDVLNGAEASSFLHGFCEIGIIHLTFLSSGLVSRPGSERTRLFLFDAPEGSPMRILVVAMAAPEEDFERAVEAFAPVVLDFHTP